MTYHIHDSRHDTSLVCIAVSIVLYFACCRGIVLRIDVMPWFREWHLVLHRKVISPDRSIGDVKGICRLDELVEQSFALVSEVHASQIADCSVAMFAPGDGLDAEQQHQDEYWRKETHDQVETDCQSSLQR